MHGNYEILYNPMNSTKHSNNLHLILGIFVGCLVPVIVPPLHILVIYYFWCDNHKVINKNLCSCSCWDSVFKGPYESGAASYKHVYFNSTPNSFKLWTLTVICILLLYEAVRRLVTLMVQGRVRYSMVILFVSSMFSHYYSWWMFFNYWNDEYFSQWYHQLFFSLTEFASSVLVIVLADKLVPFSASKVLPVVAVATIHILVSSWDQFIVNVLRGEGYSFQVVRDVGFMVPDILHLVVPLLELRNQRTKQLEHRDYLIFASVVMAGLWPSYYSTTTSKVLFSYLKSK